MILGPLSIYQVSFNYLVVCFQRYALDMQKLKREVTPYVNTVDRVMILALCISANVPPSMHQVSLIPLYTFNALNKLFIEKIKGK